MRSAATGEIMYVKDLCALGRDLGRTFLVDNTPHGKINKHEIGQKRTTLIIHSFFIIII
jgi:TFIIF-interacting CTD phosphatase-like protein